MCLIENMRWKAFKMRCWAGIMQKRLQKVGKRAQKAAKKIQASRTRPQRPPRAVKLSIGLGMMKGNVLVKAAGAISAVCNHTGAVSKRRESPDFWALFRYFSKFSALARDQRACGLVTKVLNDIWHMEINDFPFNWAHAYLCGARNDAIARFFGEWNL